MKKFASIGMAAALMLSLYGCSEKEAKNVDSAETKLQEQVKKENDINKTTSVDGVDEKAFQETLATFPKTVPDKIVTTSVPLTEMLHLLNIVPVGVPTSTNPLPTDFDAITRIGSPMTPDIEVISNLQTELIIGSVALKDSLNKAVEGMNLQTAYLPTDSYEDLKLSFKVLGTYLGKEKEMNDVMKNIVAKEQELEKQAAGKELPSVMLVIGTADSFMVMNDQSYLGSLVKRLGAENIATTILKTDSTYSTLNLEDIVVADPDMIFVLASGDHGANEDNFKQEMAKNSAWKQLSAFKNDKIHFLDYSIFGVTSIANVDTALTTIADYFYK